MQCSNLGKEQMNDFFCFCLVFGFFLFYLNHDFMTLLLYFALILSFISYFSYE